MVKPPIVYSSSDAAHARLSITDAAAADHLGAMGQVPYFPPTVAGWEGGLSWLNTNTALARFAFARDWCLPEKKIDDVPGETAAAAYDRAYAAVGRRGSQPAPRQRSATTRGGAGQKLRRARRRQLCFAR